MDSAQLNWLTNFIWNIADDVLRDVYVRGKYRDVILPMTVLRRLDAVLEPTKKDVLEMKAALDKEGVTNQDDALRAASGQAFYNTSPFLLRDLKSRATQQKLKDDFEAYLDGFSPNVQDILNNFAFRNQIPKLSKADALGMLIEKFLDQDINLSPHPVGDLPALDNHSMGTMFEELVRRFNEENNEEAGEHWTPRDAVRLMANLMFLPVADRIESGTYLLYDCACGTGGMLTVAEETLQQIARSRGKQIATHLYGQEISDETYAICKADMLLKGDGDAADNIVGGSEHSTLSNDAFRGREFDFMLANPPYGKSWKADLERMGGKKDLKDPRFVIQHAGESDYSLVTRSSDGQMLFLANMLAKMKHDTPLGSRIAEVHNGSSLFTGDAGQGESNIRRWIIESDWLEAIVALPLNLFYNTGIATYVWVLSNRKAIQLRFADFLALELRFAGEGNDGFVGTLDFREVIAEGEEILDRALDAAGDDHRPGLTADFVLADHLFDEMIHHDLRLVADGLAMALHVEAQFLAGLLNIKFRVAGNGFGETIVAFNRRVVLQHVEDESFLDGLLHRVAVKRTMLYLFKKYHELYASWRDSGIRRAHHLLTEERQSVCMVALDVQEYYYRIQIDWKTLRTQIKRPVISDPFVEIFMEREIAGEKLFRCIEEICKGYRKKLKPLLEATHPDLPPTATCLPIGFCASPVIANWYLKVFDEAILENVRPAYYGRYVDDIFLVVATPKAPGEHDAKSDDPIRSFMDRVLVKSEILDWDEEHKRFELRVRPGLFLQKKKCILQFFDAEHSIAGLDKFQKQIQENASDFALLPVDGDDSPVAQVAYDLLYDGSVNKFRSVKAIAETRRRSRSVLLK